MADSGPTAVQFYFSETIKWKSLTYVHHIQKSSQPQYHVEAACLPPELKRDFKEKYPHKRGDK